jgi:hypothetical protein
MNTEFEKKPTDEQLDAMLRDVAIPSNLKSQLLGIPESTSPDDKTSGFSKQQISASATTTPASKTWATWMPYVLAASLLAITIFGASQLIPSNDRELESGTMASVDNQNSKPENKPPPKDLELVETEQAKQELQILKAKIELLEIERLKTELAMLEQLTGNQLSENEVESMIMALAPEYSIPLGGKKADVQSEMARVLMEYPNTRGAFFANKILKQIN